MKFIRALPGEEPIASGYYFPRSHEGSVSYCLVHAEGFAVFGYPVVLHRNAGEVCAGAQNLHSESTFQVSGGDSQCRGLAVDDAEAAQISQNHAAQAGAMGIRSKSLS